MGVRGHNLLTSSTSLPVKPVAPAMTMSYSRSEAEGGGNAANSEGASAGMTAGGRDDARSLWLRAATGPRRRIVGTVHIAVLRADRGVTARDLFDLLSRNSTEESSARVGETGSGERAGRDIRADEE